MTEVRSTSRGGLGLFATREYHVGEVILQEESPLIILSAPKEAAALIKMPSSKKKKGKRKQEAPTTTSLYESIVPPSSIPSHQVDNFRGMIQAAVSFVEQQQAIDSSLEQKLLQLYQPSNNDNESSPLAQEIIYVADMALAHLEKNTLGPLQNLVKENRDMAKNIMLIWSANAFEGGRLYELHSRINHSCNPNAVIQTLPEKEGQCIRAASPIQSGDEITISYLGLFLYSDTSTRRQVLQKNKHFCCACPRCTTAPDVAAAIPCPSCHKRSGGRYLDEDTQYDDEGTVHYAIGTSPSQNTVECAHCHETTIDTKKPNHPLQLAQTISTKVANHLEKQHNTSDDEDSVQEEWEEQLLQLSSSCLGARHWTTNLLLLLRLDRSLKELSSQMISTGNPPNLVQVAEMIDSLERLERFVNGLQLELHMGHLLQNVIIGVARMLVTLGDVKSKTFASDWLNKIQSDYVAHFESDNVKKVVDTLAVAWQKGDTTMAMDQDEDYQSNKRPKIS